MKKFWILLILLAGAIPPIQTAISAKLGKSLHNPLYASLISFIVGALTLTSFIVITRQTVSFKEACSIPLYEWISGILGALFVTLLILGLPRLGASYTFSLVLAGQIITALTLDHFNIFVTERHSINGGRILGATLILSGVYLIRKF